MELIMLPGNSVKSKEEIKKISTQIDSLFSSVYIHEYRHWKGNEKTFDIPYELSLLKKKLESKKELVFFAKSAGIILALMLIKKYKIKPIACVFAGTPINWFKDKNIKFESFLRGFEVPSLFIQQNQDPFFQSNNLKKLISDLGIRNSSLIEIEGEDHYYASFNFSNVIRDFLSSLKRK